MILVYVCMRYTTMVKVSTEWMGGGNVEQFKRNSDVGVPLFYLQ